MRLEFLLLEQPVKISKQDNILVFLYDGDGIVNALFKHQCAYASLNKKMK